MFGLSDAMLSGLAGVVIAIISAIQGFKVARKQVKVTEREQLSKDQQAFMDKVMTELELHRNKVEHLTEEIIKLREVNLKLEFDNRLLTEKMDDLTTELRAIRSTRGELND